MLNFEVFDAFTGFSTVLATSTTCFWPVQAGENGPLKAASSGQLVARRSRDTRGQRESIRRWSHTVGMA